MVDVLLQRFGEYDYIVEVNDGKLQCNAGQDHMHGSLECAGYVAEF